MEETAVVTLGPRRPGGLLVGAALVAVASIAVAIGTHRSSRPETRTPAATAVTAATTRPEPTIPAKVTVAPPPTSFPAVPALAGYRLRGVLGDGTVFAADIATGEVESWTPVPGRAGGVEALTSESFIVRQPDRSLVVSFDPDVPVVVVSPPGRLISADAGFAVQSIANGARSLHLFGPRGEDVGTLTPLPWSEALDVAAITADQFILEGPGSIYRVPYQAGDSRGSIDVGEGRLLANGEVISVGGGMVAYRSCDSRLDCRLRFQPARGGPEIVTGLAADDFDRGVARFTPDGQGFITATQRSDGSRQITLVDTKTGYVTRLPSGDGDQSFRGADNISVTSDSGVLVWQFDDRRFAFRHLRGPATAVVELPVPAIYITLTPSGV